MGSTSTLNSYTFWVIYLLAFLKESQSDEKIRTVNVLYYILLKKFVRTHE